MPAKAQRVRQRDLLNQLILDRTTLEELGRVEVLWMYPKLHRVLGFVGKSGFLGATKAAFKLSQLEALGENGILVQPPPEPTDADKVNQLESLLQHDVWSDRGDRVGKIIDYLFDLQTGEITHYLYVSNGLMGLVGELYQLPPNYILSMGKKRVLVPEASIAAFTVYQEGIRQTLTEVSEFFREDVAQEWQSLTRKAKTATEQSKERLQHLREEARERAQHLSEQTRVQATTWGDRLKERTKTWLEQAKEQGQTFLEQMQERPSDHSPAAEDEPDVSALSIDDIFAEDEAADIRAAGSSKPPSSAPSRPQSPAVPPADEEDEPWV